MKTERWPNVSRAGYDVDLLKHIAAVQWIDEGLEQIHAYRNTSGSIYRIISVRGALDVNRLRKICLTICLYATPPTVADSIFGVTSVWCEYPGARG